MCAGWSVNSGCLLPVVVCCGEGCWLSSGRVVEECLRLVGGRAIVREGLLDVAEKTIRVVLS